MWRVCRTLLWAICLATVTGPRLAAADPAADFARDYGSPTSAISTREAGELLLKLVNEERAKHGISELELSPSASRLAREHARDMAANDYVGHYDLEGRKCEQRYNLLGETDHVAENLALREVGARVRLTPELVTSIFSDWVSSKSHRMNIRDPAHTHMGYGFALEHSGDSTKIYAVQEFVNDWGDYSSLPSTSRPLQKLHLTGKVGSPATLVYVALANERPRGLREASEVGDADLHYRQPVVSDYLYTPKASKVMSTGLYPTYPRMKYNAVDLNVNGQFDVEFAVPSLVRRDLYVTVWVRVESDWAKLKDGFGDSSTPEEGSYEAEGPWKGHPFRVMTQVIRIE